jgi:hypothetical protein
MPGGVGNFQHAFQRLMVQAHHWHFIERQDPVLQGQTDFLTGSHAINFLVLARTSTNQKDMSLMPIDVLK